MKKFNQQILVGLLGGLFLFIQTASAANEASEELVEDKSLTTEKSAKIKKVAPEKGTAVEKETAVEEEIDVSELSEEYWQPQKDDLEVIQNKKFQKEGRVEASLLYSFFQTHQYSDSTAYGLNLAYNLSERWALEGSYLKINNSASDFLSSVRSQYGFTPEFNNEQSQSLAMFTWSPIYGKFALLGKKISHYDFYFSLGAGITETAENHFSKAGAVGNRFFLYKGLVFRIEFRVVNYTDKISVTQGTAAVRNGGPGYVMDTITRRNLVFGLGWLF